MRWRHDKTVVRALLVFGALTAVGCQSILGIQIPDGNTGGAAGSGGNGPTGGAAGTTATAGTAGTTTTAGSGGTGGAGGATMSGSGGATMSGSGGGPCTDCLEPVWSQSLDGPGDQLVNDVAVDAAGNVVFVGSASGSSDFKGDCPVGLGASCPINAQDQDVYIVKLSQDGEPVWVRSAAGADAQEATAVAVDKAGNVFVAGNFLGSINFGSGVLTSAGSMDQDVFVVKFGPDGTPLWSQRFGDSTDQKVGGVALDDNNDVLLVGQFVGKIDFGGATAELTSAGGYDVFVAKLDGASGEGIWSDGFGDAEGQIGTKIAVAPNGDIAITGQCIGTMNVPDDNMTGHCSSMNCGNEADVFAVKLDSSGKCLWSNHFGNEAATSEGRAVAIDGAGDVLVSGYYISDIDFVTGNMHLLQSQGGIDAFVSKLDGAGSAIWSRSFASAGSEEPKELLFDGAHGKVYVTGSLGTGSMIDFNGSVLMSAGGTDIFVASYDALTGDPICGVTYGDGKDQMGASLALSSAGELILGASFKGSVDLMCSQSVASSSLNDALVAKLKPLP